MAGLRRPQPGGHRRTAMAVSLLLGVFQVLLPCCRPGRAQGQGQPRRAPAFALHPAPSSPWLWRPRELGRGRPRCGSPEGRAWAGTASRARPAPLCAAPAPRVRPLCVARGSPPRPGALQLCSPRREVRGPWQMLRLAARRGVARRVASLPASARAPRPLCSHPRLAPRGSLVSGGGWHGDDEEAGSKRFFALYYKRGVFFGVGAAIEPLPNVVELWQAEEGELLLPTQVRTS